MNAPQNLELFPSDNQPLPEHCASFSFGPCQFCEYQPTTAYCTDNNDRMEPTCDLCLERLRARAGLLREPEFYVI